MKSIAFLFAFSSLSCLPLFAQLIFIDEDFSSGTFTTPPAGWAQQVIAGDPAVDLWHFDNPGNRILNAPIAAPAAIFDSDNYSDNNMVENVALVSPVFDASGVSAVWLEVDHYFNGGSGGAFHIEVFDGINWVSVLSGTTDSQNPEQLLMDISALAAGNALAQVRFRWTGNWSFWWIVDNVKVSEPPSKDIGVAAVTSPESSCFLGQETISVEIENFGVTALDSFQLAYIVNPGTGSPVIEFYSGLPIPPNQSRFYSFNTPADFSAVTNYTIEAFTILSGDANTGNDSVATIVSHLPPVPAPISEDMESFIIGTPGVLMNGWTNSAGKDIDWQVHAGPTSSSSTGPIADHTTGINTGKYLYTEASGGNQGDISELLSPCIDLSPMNGPGLYFWYHMYGLHIGSLEVDVVSDNGVATLFSLSGQQQSSSTEAWREGKLSLAAYSGQVVQLIFRGIRGSGFQSDMALDDIGLEELPSVDLGLTSMLRPLSDACHSQSEELSLEVSNFSFQDIDFSGLNATIQIDIDGPIQASYSKVLSSGILQAGEKLIVAVTDTADLSVAGTYTLTAYTMVSGDNVTSNDTISISLVQPGSSISAPFFEDFESATVGIPGVLPGGWTQAANDQDDWRINSGPTSTLTTGPLVDHTTQSFTGKYLYVEATNSAGGDKAELLSPCIDLSNVNNPGLSFWYHMYGSDIGTLEVDVLRSDTIITVFSLSGQQQTSSAENWREAFVSLMGLGSQVRLRFRVVKTDMFNGDIALDDISIFDITTTELQLSEIVGLGEEVCADTALPMTIRVTNNGADTLNFDQHALALAIEFSGANNLAIYDTIYSGTLAFLESLEISFSQTANLSGKGITTVRAYHNLVSGDAIPSNDTLLHTVTVIPLISAFPYVESFESGMADWTPGGNFPSWAWGTPAKETIQGAASGTRAWTTGGLGTGFYHSNERSWIVSPCFDLTQASENSWISMSIWWESEFSFDGAVLQFTSTEGKTWFNLGQAGDPNNWFNDNTISGNPGGQQTGWTGRTETGNGSGGWVKALYPLPDSLLNGEKIRFRIAFGADLSIQDDGFAFDDFAISSPPLVDLGPDSLVICNNQQLDAGNPGSSYLWSTGESTQNITITNNTASPIRDSLIFVTVTDSLGLTGSDSIVVSIPSSPPIEYQINSITNPTCDDDTTAAIDISVSGGLGSAYLVEWSNGKTGELLTGIAAGDYSAVITDSIGCSITTDLISIEAMSGNPLASFIVVDTVGPSLVFANTSMGTDASSTFFWDFGNGNTSQEENPSQYFGSNGSFIVSLTITNPCGSDTARDTVEILTTGIGIDLQNAIRLYPNPTRDYFELSFEAVQWEEVSVSVSGVNGNLIFEEQIGAVQLPFSYKVFLPQQLTKGVYLVRIRSKQGEVYRRLAIR